MSISVPSHILLTPDSWQAPFSCPYTYGGEDFLSESKECLHTLGEVFHATGISASLVLTGVGQYVQGLSVAGGQQSLQDARTNSRILELSLSPVRLMRSRQVYEGSEGRHVCRAAYPVLHIPTRGGVPTVRWTEHSSESLRELLWHRLLAILADVVPGAARDTLLRGFNPDTFLVAHIATYLTLASSPDAPGDTYVSEASAVNRGDEAAGMCPCVLVRTRRTSLDGREEYVSHLAIHEFTGVQTPPPIIPLGTIGRPSFALPIRVPYADTEPKSVLGDS